MQFFPIVYTICQDIIEMGGGTVMGNEAIDRYFRKLEDGDYKLLFGKHCDENLSSVIKYDYGYINWMLHESNFDSCVKEFVAERMGGV